MKNTVRAALLLCSALLPPASAQLLPGEDPVALGPLGGSATNVHVTPGNPSSVYAFKYTQGLFHSTDGGLTFGQIGAGLGGDADDLTQDPAASHILYMVDDDRVMRSVDAGFTFSPLGLTAPYSLKNLAVQDPGGVLLATSAFDIHRSTDGGVTWSTVHSVVPFGGDVLDDVQFAPSNPNVAYCSWNKGVLRSTDGGATWAPTPGLTASLKALGIDPTDEDTIFASVSFQGLYKSTDGGVTFALAATGLGGFDFGQFLSWDPHGRIWFALLDALYVSSDGGTTWVDGSAGITASPFPIPLDIAYDSNGKILLGTESGSLGGFVGGGIYSSTGPGVPWAHTGFSEAAVSAVAIAGPGGKRLAGLDSGIMAASPGQLLVSQANPFPTEDIVVAPQDPTRWISGGVGFFFDNAQVIANLGDGANIFVVYETFGAGTVQDLEFDPFDPNRVLGGIFPGGFGNESLILSTDGGQNWLDVPGTQGWATRAVAFDPHNAGVALQVSDDGSWSLSGDGGLSWLPLQPAWPGTGTVFAAYDPFLPNVLYRGSTGGGLMRSDTGGTSWISLGVSLHAESGLALHPDLPGYLYVSDASGQVLVSTDRGQTFTTLWSLGANASKLAIDTADGSLLVGTSGASTWDLPRAAPHVIFGDGTPGTGGVVPSHYPGGGLPQLGSATFALEGEGVVGGAPVFQAYGVGGPGLPLFGGELYLSQLIGLVATVATGTPGLAGGGTFSVAAPVPSSPSLAGVQIVSQAVVLDAGAADPSGLVLSNALTTTLIP